MTDEVDVVEIKRSLVGMAELLITYVRELESQGFTRDEAVKIAIAWQRLTLTLGTSDA